MRTSERTAPVLLVSTPIEDALSQLDAKADDLEHWNGPDSPAPNALRLAVQTVRKAMRLAEEHWSSTAETARITGWSEETLVRHARLHEKGEPAHDWRGLRVQRGRVGFVFQPSTVPVKARKAS